MKQNRSLAISTILQEFMQRNMLGSLERVFPSEIFSKEIPAGRRNRVFTPERTLLTMLLTSVQQDKTLRNSVDLYYIIHQRNRRHALTELGQQANELREQQQTPAKKPGRPRKPVVQLPKSLDRDISLNTAAYSKARDRMPLGLTRQMFEASRMHDARSSWTHWHGYRVMTGDGTYVQLQDTAAIRASYTVKVGRDSPGAYPQGLLEVIAERGTGQIHSFRLSDRHKSELALFQEMIDELPQRSLLLLDDLYNCYETFAKCIRKGVHVVVPGKRKRTCHTVEVLAQGDELVTVPTPKNRSKWTAQREKAGDLLLRRIMHRDSKGKEHVLFTTVLDRAIGKDEIQLLYLSRWDIEIGIREIKTVMDVNILRAKTPEMALKELTVSLSAYNLIRKLIYESIRDMPFSPKEDFIYKLHALNKDVLIDKKGRVYNRWSTGRRRTGRTDKETAPAQKKA